MKMIGLVLALEHAQHLEQLVGLGRRQHRGRLVEHEDFGAAHQRFQDLDPLLQADRQFADDGVGIDLETVFAPEFGELLADRASALGEQRPALGAEHHVFEHAQRRHQHEMLENHADAVADRFARRADPDRLAVDADLAGVGFIEAVEDRHQRRFAGPVFADDAVDDAALDDQIDVVVGVNRPEALVDANEFDGGRRLNGHVRRPPSCRLCDGQVVSLQATLERGKPASKAGPGPAMTRGVRRPSSRALAHAGHLLSDM